MGNKINPLGLRIGVNKSASVRWYANTKKYPALIGQDEKIRKVVMKEVGHSGIARIEIERAAHNVNVTISSAKPGVVIGKGGEAIKELRNKLEKEIGGTVGVNVQEAPNANTNAMLIAQRVAEQLERRFAFRRAMKQAVQRTMESGAQGVKVRCSGRLGGAEQARPEQYMEGRVPLQTLRADIDYGTAEASTTYGIIGIKAWVFNGEIVGDQRRRAAMLPRSRPKDDEAKKGKRRRPQQARRRSGTLGQDRQGRRGD
jgi:small subunit ribosomal protein S3